MLVPSETRAWTTQIGVPLPAKPGQAAIKWKVPGELARRMVHTTEARRFAEQRARDMAAPPAKTAAAQKAAQVNKFEHVGKKKVVPHKAAEQTAPKA
jgi:hypothetical protein